MATYSGRTNEDRPVADEIERHEIPLFIKRCRDEGWKRVAVCEHLTILALYQRDIDKTWLHPQLLGMN